MTRPLLLIALAGAAATARAQETVTYSLSFTEVLAGTATPVPNPDRIIEPGEGARVGMTVTIAPGISSPATYTPPPAPGFGTIAGLASISFDLTQTSALGGTWSLFDRNPAGYPWTLGSPGTGTSEGGVAVVQAGQFVLPGAIANSTNPVANISRGTWTPSTYSPRTVRFTSAPPGTHNPSDNSWLFVEYGTDPNTGAPLYIEKRVTGAFGSSVDIPIVPAPAPGAWLLVIMLSTKQRKRC